MGISDRLSALIGAAAPTVDRRRDTDVAVQPWPCNERLGGSLYRDALCLIAVLAAPANLTGQGHFPTDSAVKQLTQRVIPTGGDVGVVIGMLESDGSRRVVTVGKASYNGETLFEIGSITKVFTGILLADMADRGEVRLDQPVQDLLPDSVRVPRRGAHQITLVDLSTHSSGLPYMPDNLRPRDPTNPFADYSATDLYEFLRAFELQRDIGAQWEYSNIGGALLGHALSVRANMSYDDLVTTRILQPLGMSSTFSTIPNSARHRLAFGHNEDGGRVRNWDLDVFAGAGALRSTADDLLTFLAANVSPPNTRLGRAIRQTHLVYFRQEGPGGAGLGWSVHTTDFGRPLVLHGGTTGGYRAFIAFDPERRIGVVVLSNRLNAVPVVGQHLLDTRYPLRAPSSRRTLTAMGAAFVSIALPIWWWMRRRRRIRSVPPAA